MDVLRRELQSGDVRLLDCRHKLNEPEWGRREYAQGHLPGAVHAHIDHDLSGPVRPTTGRHPLPTPQKFRAVCSAWGIAPKTRVVVYDDAGGIWAARAWWLLRDYGHEDVRLLDGGIQAWRRAGLPLTSEVPRLAPATFGGTPGHMPSIDAAGLQRLLQDPSLSLLDARAPERYRGDVEPIDPVAGHIPGARNLPAASLSTPEGTLPAPAVLRARFEAAGVPDAKERVAYCGSGVTGSLLVLAADAAGVPRLSLYPGSWSEWIRDPKRPIERGGVTSPDAQSKITDPKSSPNP